MVFLERKTVLLQTGESAAADSLLLSGLEYSRAASLIAQPVSLVPGHLVACAS